MDRELAQILTPAGYKILRAYRTRQPLSNEQMAAFLGKSRQALDRANVRLLKSARQMFPASALTSVSVLASEINAFCGKPAKKEA